MDRSLSELGRCGLGSESTQQARRKASSLRRVQGTFGLLQFGQEGLDLRARRLWKQHIEKSHESLASRGTSGPSLPNIGTGLQGKKLRKKRATVPVQDRWLHEVPSGWSVSGFLASQPMRLAARCVHPTEAAFLQLPCRTCACCAIPQCSAYSSDASPQTPVKGHRSETSPTRSLPEVIVC